MMNGWPHIILGAAVLATIALCNMIAISMWHRDVAAAVVKTVDDPAEAYLSHARQKAAQEPPMKVRTSATWLRIERGRLAVQFDLGTPRKAQSEPLQHINQDCYGSCGGPGLCKWCGDGNACCRLDFPWDPAICKKAQNFVSSPPMHECVEVGTTFPDARASVMLDGREILRTPTYGMWTVGRNLSSGWPSKWDIGGITSSQAVRIDGPWLVVEGVVETPEGSWLVKDQWRLYDGVVEGQRDWLWQGSKETLDSVLAVAWTAVNASGNGLFLPGVSVHGNPSGQKAGAGIPKWNGNVAHEILQVEEHRLAQTWVNYEWVSSSGELVSAALDVEPSQPPFGHHPDLWWSLGAESASGNVILQALSGPVAFNSELGKVKTGAFERTPFTNVGLAVPPYGRIQKRYRLHVGNPLAQGSGFRIPLSWTISRADLSLYTLPRFSDIVEAKVRFALSRWSPENEYPGFGMYPGDRNTYTMGWAGQSEAPGYALQVLASCLGRDDLRDIAYKTLDSLSTAPFDEGGFKLELKGNTGTWKNQDFLSQGQAMNTFANAIAFARKSGVPKSITQAWETFLQKACNIHSDRILHSTWKPHSTNEAFLVQPLAMSAKIFVNDRFLQAAVKAGEHYRKRHAGLNEPFWGGTLDASCEDKEGAWAGFQAFLALHEATGEAKWLEAANYAADVTLTYTYTWDVHLPPGRLRDRNLKTRGWTTVSVQNMHLDMYGVLYTPSLWRLGQLSNRPELFRLSEVMFRSCGQMLDAAGSQGEQLQQTRYAQQGNLKEPEKFRGGYVESWSVFWITAHFLTAAAKFEEMGVLAQLWDKL